MVFKYGDASLWFFCLEEEREFVKYTANAVAFCLFGFLGKKILNVYL